MAEGRHEEKTKNSPHPKRDEGCLCIKLRGTTQIAKDNVSPAAFGALTLRSVRFTFAGSSGVARNDPDRSTLQPWALSLDGGVCISDPFLGAGQPLTNEGKESLFVLSHDGSSKR
jgi:hypothetical protein